MTLSTYALLCICLLFVWPSFFYITAETSRPLMSQDRDVANIRLQDDDVTAETSRFLTSQDRAVANILLQDDDQLRGKTIKKSGRTLNNRYKKKKKSEGKETKKCLKSPLYPRKYPDNSDTVQNLAVGAGQTIEVTFEDFKIEHGSSKCPYDYLKFVDGNGKTVGGKLCGYSKPNKITIETSTAQVLFHSDDADTYKGFKFCYSPGFPKCFTSPNYPKNYPKATDIRETFSVPEGFSIDVTFEDLDVENRRCNYDYIQFYDGNSKRLGDKICGTALPDIFNIPTSSASFIFHSDSDEQGKGFKFCYKPGKEMGTCLTSPGYPGPYPNNDESKQALEVPAGQRILVTFLQFDVEESSSCSYDYLEVLDASGKRVGQKLCGDSLPRQINIQTSTAEVVFHSDQSVTRRGFKLCYFPVPAPITCGQENLPLILTRISGGTETAPNQFPWMVRLPMGCGGSFITDTHILTAKHCLDKKDWRGRMVKVSVHDQADSEDYEQVPIKDYVWPELGEFQDIAIITLEWAVDLSDNTIGTVCLPVSADEDYRGKKALAMGWGWNPDTEGQSSRLQKLQLTVADTQEDIWLYTKVVFKDGVPLDVCRGDSGGPLVYREDDGRWTIIGTVQGGSYCNNHSGANGRWNKVTGHLQWIKKVIGQ